MRAQTMTDEGEFYRLLFDEMDRHYAAMSLPAFPDEPSEEEEQDLQDRVCGRGYCDEENPAEEEQP